MRSLFLLKSVLSLCSGYVLGDENVGCSTLTLICENLAVKCQSSAFKYIFSILGILSIMLLAVAVGFIITTRYIMMLKAQVLQILRKPLLRMLQPQEFALYLSPSNLCTKLCSA